MSFLDAPEMGRIVVVTGAEDESPDGPLLIRAVAAHDGVVGDPDTFGAVARDVLAEARRERHVEAEVVALRAVAWWEHARMDNARALRLLQRAVRLSRQHALPHRLGEVLTSRAAVHLELGRITAARRDLARAAGLVSAEAAPDLQLKRAVLLCNTGDVAAGAEILRSVVESPAPVSIRTRAANNLALAESLLGRTRDALRHIGVAGELAVEVGPAFVGYVAHNRGVVLAQAGRLAEALRQFDESAELMARAGLPLAEAQVELADTLAALRAVPEARRLCERAVAELEAHDVPLMVAEARLREAEIALLAGDLAAAGRAAQEAVLRFRRQRRAGWAALATVLAVEVGLQSGAVTGEDVARACRAADTLRRSGTLSGAVRADEVAGRAALAAGRWALAQRRLRSAHEQARRGPVLVRLRGRLAGALAAAACGDGRTALAHCRAGLVDLDAHRAALPSAELRAMASGHGVELGRIGLGVLLGDPRRPARIFGWTERTRAAALLVVQEPDDDDLRSERAALAALRVELVEARARTGAEPAALLALQAAGEARIRRATWRRQVSAGAPGRARSAAEVRAALGDRALASFVRQGDDVLAVVLDRAGTRLVPLGPLAPLRFEADGLLFALRRLTRRGSPAGLHAARASAEHALRQLRRLALAPLGLDPEVPLVVVPTGDTHRVPWSALHDGPVSVVPSASLWTATAERSRRPVRSVAVIAGPGLTGAQAEADAVAAHHGGATVIPPPAATTAAVVPAMAGADLVHLACHGSLRSDNPLFSALLLQDGPLTLHDLDAHRIAPHRLVLASCDSAAGTVYAGDEVLGFVGALLARGTAGLVASVVVVGDVASTDLMDGLHAGLARGLPADEALHAARGKIDVSDPLQFVNWCGFTAYGAG